MENIPNVHRMIRLINVVLENEEVFDNQVETIRDRVNNARHINEFNGDFEKKAFDRIIAAVDNPDNTDSDILQEVATTCYIYADDYLEYTMPFIF